MQEKPAISDIYPPSFATRIPASIFVEAGFSLEQVVDGEANR
jgi:hypothetical protein